MQCRRLVLILLDPCDSFFRAGRGANIDMQQASIFTLAVKNNSLQLFPS